MRVSSTCAAELDRFAVTPETAIDVPTGGLDVDSGSGGAAETNHAGRRLGQSGSWIGADWWAAETALSQRCRLYFWLASAPRAIKLNGHSSRSGASSATVPL